MSMTSLLIDELSGLRRFCRMAVRRPMRAPRWGGGGGHVLRVDRHGGTRVEGLNCWENRMPQARHAMYAQGRRCTSASGLASRRNTEDIVHFIATAGRVFSLAANSLISLSNMPADSRCSPSCRRRE
jgi:nitrilase